MKKIFTVIFVTFLLSESFSVFSQNVGINTTGLSGDASSMLDVSASDKGVLIPRVSLSDVTNGTTPINTPAVGLLVYNANAAVIGGFGAGFYYWNGAWTKMATGNSLTATLTNGRIWIGNGSNVPTEQLISGDGVIGNTGVLDLNNLAVETSEINDLAVTTVKIADANITTAKIADGNVTTVKIADNAVDGTKINIASNATGDLMFYNGTDWVRLASGSTGQVLTTSGSAPSWSNPSDLLVVENGLTKTSPNIIRLGGTLTQATTITQSTFGLGVVNNGTSNTTINLSSTGDFDVQDNGTSAFFVRDDANVGVGTNNPGSKLEVVGPATGSGATIRANGGGDVVLNTGGSLFFDGNYSYGAGNYIRPTATNKQSFVTAGTERMNIAPNGNVGIGIGTANATYGLELGGTFGYGNGRSRTETRDDAGQMSTQSGFFETSAPAPAANWYPGANSWQHLIDVRHSNGANNFAMQIAGSFFDQNLWFRKTNNSAAQAWTRILTTNDNGNFIQNQSAAAQGANFWISGNGFLNGNLGLSNTAVPYKLTIGGAAGVFGVDNQASFLARNSASGYETYFWPRWSDNVMYMNYGSGGMNIRDNGSNIAMFISPGGNRAVGIGAASGGYRLHNFGDTYTDGGWYRVSGNQGYYFETHGGGWQMTDATWMRSYNAKAILATGGLAGAGNSVFGTPYGISPRMYANYDNAGSGGIIIADDGGFADYNDGWIQFRGSTGIMVRTDNTSWVTQLTMTNSTGGGANSDKNLGTSAANWGTVGNGTLYWYRMYAGGFVNSSRRDCKRNITTIDASLASVLLNDIDNLKPSLYKYKEETDKMVVGQETKFRPNWHIGLIVDEAPDYLQDETFMGVDIYAASSLALFGVKNNREEIKEIKNTIGLSDTKKKISDFGSAIVTSATQFIPFTEEFKLQLMDNVIPVVTVTGNDADVRIAIIKKDQNGFTINVSNLTNNLQIDYIAFAQVNIDKNITAVSPEIMEGLRVSESDKQQIKSYLQKRNEQDKINEENAAREAEKVKAERKKEIENGAKFANPADGPVPTFDSKQTGPESTNR